MNLYFRPFRHAVLDNFLDRKTLRAINAQWPTEWDKEDGKGQRKWSTTKLPKAAGQVASGLSTSIVEEATGITGLFQDPELFGGGLHCVPPGGFLRMHVDFNVHPKGWHRRANVLIYLNEHWDEDWGGHLCLGKNREKRIAPIGGRCVIFETTEDSWHGHPELLNCPKDIQRRSMALYFYSETILEAKAHSTIYEDKHLLR